MDCGAVFYGTAITGVGALALCGVTTWREIGKKMCEKSQINLIVCLNKEQVQEKTIEIFRNLEEVSFNLDFVQF